MMQDLVGDMCADSTLTAQQSLWRRFVKWCEVNAMEMDGGLGITVGPHDSDQ